MCGPYLDHDTNQPTVKRQFETARENWTWTGGLAGITANLAECDNNTAIRFKSNWIEWYNVSDFLYNTPA